MALSISHLLKFETPLGVKVHETVSSVLALLTGATIKQRYEAEANTNTFTDAEKAKLAALDPNHFRGTFANLTALQAVTGVAGDYVDVDTGVGSDVQRYIYDVNDADWVLQSGSVTSETAATVKAKYESNPDTNAFTDGDQTKLNNLTATAPIDLDTVAAEQVANSTARHAAVTLAANTGFTISGQEITNSYAALPVA